MVKHANLLFISLLCGFIAIFSAGAALALAEMTFMVPAVVFLTIAVLSSRRFDHLTDNN